MKTTEKVQGTLCGARLAHHPNSNGMMGDSAGKRSLAAVLLRLGVIFAVLLLMITTISGCAQERTQPYKQGITEDGRPNDPIEVPGIAAADSGRSETITINEANVVGVLELRSLADGLSVDEIKTIQAYAIAKAEAKGLMQGMKDRFAADDEYMSIAKCVPVLQAGEVIVAFGVVMGTDGVPSHFTGVACCPESVTVARRLAREWYKRELVRVRQLDPQASNPSGTSASEWILKSSGEHIRPRRPYGVVGHSWEVVRLMPDPCRRRNIYAVRHFSRMEPGRLRWRHRSTYQNDFMRITHSWRDEVTAELVQWGSHRTVTGEQTFHITVSAAGPGFGWDYSQPAVTTRVYSSRVTDIARWDSSFHVAARTTTATTNPGSSAHTRQNQPRGVWLRLVDIQVTGRFQRGLIGRNSPDVIVARWISIRYN